MKVWIYTANDIENNYPEKVFDSEEKARAYRDSQLAEAKKAFLDGIKSDNRTRFGWQDSYFYGDIEEREVE